MNEDYGVAEDVLELEDSDEKSEVYRIDWIKLDRKI